MNLVELYLKTPVEKHSQIIVRGDEVYLVDDEGDANPAYLIKDDQLLPVYSARKLKQDITAIKKKLGVP